MAGTFAQELVTIVFVVAGPAAPIVVVLECCTMVPPDIRRGAGVETVAEGSAATAAAGAAGVTTAPVPELTGAPVEEVTGLCANTPGAASAATAARMAIRFMSTPEWNRVLSFKAPERSLSAGAS